MQKNRGEKKSKKITIFNSLIKKLKNISFKKERNSDIKSQDSLKVIIKENIIIISVAILCALLFRSFVLDPFRVPSGSMMPNLLPGDRMFAKKWSFGYSKYSFPNRVIPIKGKVFGKLPKRGEIVIFTLPKNDKIFYVKRVIGLPGDIITLVNNIVHVNNKPLEQEVVRIISETEYSKMSSYKGEYEEYPVNQRDVLFRYNETSPDNISYQIINPLTNFVGSNMSRIVVPEGHCFMMGDNRGNSLDSRFEDVGFIPLENIIAKPYIIFFSSEGSLLSSILNPKKIRFNRMFSRLDNIKNLDTNLDLINDTSSLPA